MNLKSILIIGMVWDSLVPGKCWRLNLGSLLIAPAPERSSPEVIESKNISALNIPEPENILTFGSCIQLAGHINITIPVLVQEKDTSKVSLSRKVLQVPSNATVTGQCQSEPRGLKILQLSWTGTEKTAENILQFHFFAQDESYSLDFILFQQPQRKLQAVFIDLGPITTTSHLGNSSYCTAHQLTDSSSKVFLALKDFRFEVFTTTPLRRDVESVETRFSPAPVDLCSEDFISTNPAQELLDAFSAQGTSWSTYLINLVILLISCFILFGLVVGLIKLHKHYKRNNKTVHELKV